MPTGEDKFTQIPIPIAKQHRKWEAAAIEACRNDPRVAKAGLCCICMVKLPDCLCRRLALGQG